MDFHCHEKCLIVEIDGDNRLPLGRRCAANPIPRSEGAACFSCGTNADVLGDSAVARGIAMVAEVQMP